LQIHRKQHYEDNLIALEAKQNVRERISVHMSRGERAENKHYWDGLQGTKYSC